MWYATWNKNKVQFEIQFSVTPISRALKSHTKNGLWRQIRSNFAYLMCIRKYGKCTFVLIKNEQTKVEHEVSYKYADKHVERYGRVTYYQDGSRTNYIYNYRMAV